MDNPYNKLLVEEIKSEAKSASIYEAFLESAPQLIVQISFLLQPKISTLLSKILISFTKHVLRSSRLAELMHILQF